MIQTTIAVSQKWAIHLNCYWVSKFFLWLEQALYRLHIQIFFFMFFWGPRESSTLLSSGSWNTLKTEQFLWIYSILLKFINSDFAAQNPLLFPHKPFQMVLRWLLEMYKRLFVQSQRGAVMSDSLSDAVREDFLWADPCWDLKWYSLLRKDRGREQQQRQEAGLVSPKLLCSHSLFNPAQRKDTTKKLLQIEFCHHTEQLYCYSPETLQVHHGSSIRLCPWITHNLHYFFCLQWLKLLSTCRFCGLYLWIVSFDLHCLLPAEHRTALCTACR